MAELSTTLDYDALVRAGEEVGRPCHIAARNATRLRNGLAHHLGSEITYERLVELFSSARLHKQAGIRGPYLRNIGPTTMTQLYRHLHEVGIEVLPDGYTSLELGVRDG